MAEATVPDVAAETPSAEQLSAPDRDGQLSAATATTATSKRTTAREAAPKKATAPKAAPPKAAPPKAAADTVSSKKAAPKKAAAKEATDANADATPPVAAGQLPAPTPASTTPAAKRPAAKKPAAKKAAAKKAAAKKPPGRASAKRSASGAAATGESVTKAPSHEHSAAGTMANSSDTGHTAVESAGADASGPAAAPSSSRPSALAPPGPQKEDIISAENAPGPLPVRPGEDPWTDSEVAEIRAELQRERDRLIEEIADADAQLAEMLRDAGEGSGDDQADAGSRTFEREQEISLAANTMEMLDQVDRASRRMDRGTYGWCENCGQPIGKLRLMAFPRATLCLTCKEREERR